MSSDVEPAKKVLLPYLQRADELQKHEPLVAYYCRLYAMERGLKIPTKERTKTTSAILVSLMNQLEKDKKSVQLSPEDNLYVEGFALSVFAKADKQDRAGRADLNTAKTFYAASIFIDILHQFGSLQPDIEQKQKYALWKAADIRKALSEGRKPMPGPPGGDEEFSLSPRGALDLEVRPDNAATRAPEGRPQGQQASNMGFGVGSPSLVGGSKMYTDQALQPDLPDNAATRAPEGRPHIQQGSNMGFGVGSPSLVGRSKMYTDQALQPDLPDQYSGNTEHGMPKLPLDFAHSGYTSPYPGSYYPSSSMPAETSTVSPSMAASQYESRSQLDAYNDLPHKAHYHEYAQMSAKGSMYSSMPTTYIANNGDSDAVYYQSQGGHVPSTVTYPASAPFSADYGSFAGLNDPSGLERTTSAPMVSFKEHSYHPAPDKIAEAQKTARFAVSALAFDDVPTAISYLKQSLELLTNRSAA